MTDLWSDNSEWSEQESADFVLPPKVTLVESQRLPPLAYLILETQQGKSLVLREWVEKVLPGIITNLCLTHAKGMSRAELQRNDFFSPTMTKEQREKAITKLESMPVQSLSVHIMNAALSAWTVIELANLSEDEQRLYLAGVTMHDLNKMVEREIAQGLKLEGEKTELYKTQFIQWGQALGLWNFIEESRWQDVAFLAQNAEAVRGENRTLANYAELKTDPAMLEDISEFVRLADLIASVAQHPDDLSQMTGANKVPQLLQRVLRNKYHLRYHRTTENRGLLTQVIHNAVRETAEACGWVPFLFFPDGITYLVPKDATEPDLNEIPTQVRQKLITTVSDRLGALVTRGPLGIKFTPEYTELLDPKTAGKLLIRRLFDIISDKKLPVTEERKAKTQFKRGVSAELDLSYGASLSADRVAEGMFGLSKLLEEYYGGSRETHGEALIRGLDLGQHIPAFNSIDFSGGVGYPWYYIGGHFAKANPGLSTPQLEEKMWQVYEAVITELGEPQREQAFGFLNDYILQVLTLGSSVSNRDFAAELERYEKSKARGGKRTCAICNSAFETREDFSSYSNKKVVSSKAQSGRGICEVCQAEELLRRFALGQTMREEGQTKFLHLYPTYFFTPVTASAMSFAYRQLKNVVFSDIAKELQANDFEVRKLAETDIFKVAEPPNDKRRLERVSYSENEMHAYYLLGVPYLGREPSDTQSWFMPSLLALVVPLVFGVKVAASSSAQPTYPTGADFPVPTDMVVIDGAHSFWQHGMKRSSFGLTDLEPAIKAACSMYGLLSEAFKDSSGFAIWNQLGAVARELDSDPLAVFGYADRIESQQSKGKATVTSTDGMAPYLAERLTDYYGYITHYYQTILGEGGSRMAMIEDLVEKYASFYRARGRAAYGRLRPISLAADVVLDSPVELDRSSLQLQIEGRIFAMLDGVRDRVTEGWIPKGAWTDAERQPFVEEFARYFLVSIFDEYCRSDRAMLRKRLNLLKNGAEAVYVKKYGMKQTEVADTAQVQTTQEVQAEGGDK